MNLDEQITNLKIQWKEWGDKRCEGIDLKTIRDEYRSFAATMCTEAIKKLIKDKDGDY